VPVVAFIPEKSADHAADVLTYVGNEETQSRPRVTSCPAFVIRSFGSVKTGEGRPTHDAFGHGHISGYILNPSALHSANPGEPW
jgi:hypothetical protein